MSNQNRIALFVDIDNMPLNKEHIDAVINQLETNGDIVYARFYGVTDRRHRDIICDAVARGFETVPPVNPKKRGSTKVFDNRILIDLCELVYTNMSIDSVAIVANPTNLVHLFAKLKKEDIGIYACDNLDGDSLAFADEILQFGYDDPNTKAKLNKELKKAVKYSAEEKISAEEPAEQEYSSPTVINFTEHVSETAEAEESGQDDGARDFEETFEKENAGDVSQDTEEIIEETSAEEISDEVTEEKEEEKEAETVSDGGRDDDLDILRQIQQMKEDVPSGEDEEDAELIEKIKKLLDEFN